MSKEEKIKTFTASDIERYHKGLMSPKERNALEKAALDDPLLADALEGYGPVTDSMQEDLADLRNRLANRTKKTGVEPLLTAKASYAWWKVAAMIVVVIGVGLLVYQLVFNRKLSELAQVQKNSPGVTANKDSTGTSIPSNSTPDNNRELDSATSGLIKDDNKNGQANQGLLLKETETAPVNKKENTDASGTDNAIDKQNLKSPATTEPEAPAKNVDEKVTNALPKPEEPLAKSRRIEKAPVASEDVEYKQAESKPNAAIAIPQARSYRSDASVRQPNVFRGRVTDNDNNALPFSNITNLSDNIGTYSDARGNFVLTSPDSVLNVQIRSLGFETTNAQLVPSSQENKIQLDGDKSITATVLDNVKRNTNRSRNVNMKLEEPEPADGWSNYDMYLANNLKTPETFKSKQRSGTVELEFDVDSNGVPYNIIIKKSLCENCDKEAIRLIKDGPKWKRKLKKGAKATVTVSF